MLELMVVIPTSRKPRCMTGVKQKGARDIRARDAYWILVHGVLAIRQVLA